MADWFVFGVTCRRYCLRETGPQIAQCPRAASPALVRRGELDACAELLGMSQRSP
jgi:hypothetical protein